MVPEEKAFPEEKAESRANISSNESVRTRRVIIGTLRDVESTSLRLDAFMAINATFDILRAEEKPSKKSKKGGAKGSVASVKDSIQ